MISLWWLALGLLAAPIWWHRQKRQRVQEAPLATARFLPRADPRQLRVWRWSEPLLLLMRCLLLAVAVAWVADLVLPWRGDSVLVVPGTDKAWSEQQIREAGFGQARRIELPVADAFGWLALHEREWQDGARLLVLGDVPMPALKPQFAHQLQVRSKAQPLPKSTQRIAIASKNAAQWRAIFSGYQIDEQPGPATTLIVWDLPEAPPADKRVWRVALPADAAGARALIEQWQRLRVGVPPYTTPPQTLAAGRNGAVPASGALRDILAVLLLVLFALERIMSHARRR